MALAAKLRGHAGNPEIEYLRALAVLLVIVMHAPLFDAPHFGGPLATLQGWIHPAVGVDLFFVISGYLMGRSFVAGYEAVEAGATARRKCVMAVAFWTRRFYRLVPAACVWLGITWLGCLVFGKTILWVPAHDFFFKAMASLMMVRNIEESWATSFFGYYWSLSVENQFYLLLPIAMAASRRAWRVPLMLGICLLNALWRPGGEQWWLFRYDGLFYGLLLFEAERAGFTDVIADALPTSATGRAAFMIFCFAVLLTAPIVLLKDGPLGWSIVNIAATALVLGAIRQSGLITVPRRLRLPLSWVGARSYAIYLCHIPVWFFVIQIMMDSGLGNKRFVLLRAVLGLGIMLLACDLTYRFVELPLQAKGRIRARLVTARA